MFNNSFTHSFTRLLHLLGTSREKPLPIRSRQFLECRDTMKMLLANTAAITDCLILKEWSSMIRPWPRKFESACPNPDITVSQKRTRVDSNHCNNSDGIIKLFSSSTFTSPAFSAFLDFTTRSAKCPM